MRGEMHGEGRWGENRSPQQKCEEHLARRAGFVAYIGARLNLTAEQNRYGTRCRPRRRRRRTSSAKSVAP